MRHAKALSALTAGLLPVLLSACSSDAEAPPSSVSVGGQPAVVATAGTGSSAASGAGGAGAGATASTGKGGSAAVPCIYDNFDPATLNLVNKTGWVGCEASLSTDNPLGFQGAIYGYGDGVSCPKTTEGAVMCADGKCCMKGKTVVDTSYKSWGCGLGLELSSTGATPPVKSAYKGPVKCFDIEMTGDSGGNPVRIGFSQSVVKEGDDKIAPFLPVSLAGSLTQKVCFSDVTCPADWKLTPEQCSITGDGTPFDLQIQVAGGEAAADFNICVTKIHPISDGTTVTTPTVPVGTLTGTGKLTGQYESAAVTRNAKEYRVINNAWGLKTGGSQEIQYNGTTFKVLQQPGNNTGAAGPVSFPAVYLGSRSGLGTTGGSGLPLAVSAIKSIQTGWTNNAKTLGNAGGNFNASYDVWFDLANQAGNPSGGYLMVWFWDPSGAQPIGEVIEKNTITIAGQNWNVWYGTNSGAGGGAAVPCVSYVSPAGITSLDFDLNLFIKDAVTRGYVKNDWKLTAVHAGFEIWSGGVGLESSAFYVDVK